MSYLKFPGFIMEASKLDCAQLSGAFADFRAEVAKAHHHRGKKNISDIQTSNSGCLLCVGEMEGAQGFDGSKGSNDWLT